MSLPNDINIAIEYNKISKCNDLEIIEVKISGPLKLPPIQ